MSAITSIDGVVTTADGKRRAFRVHEGRWEVWDGQAARDTDVDQALDRIASATAEAATYTVCLPCAVLAVNGDDSAGCSDQARAAVERAGMVALVEQTPQVHDFECDFCEEPTYGPSATLEQVR